MNTSRGTLSVDSWLTPMARTARHRWTLLVLVAIAAGVTAGGRGDWDAFVGAGRAMLGGDGFGVFVAHRDVQTGPLSLLVARIFSSTLRNGFVLGVIACGALGQVAVRSLERAALESGRRPGTGTHLTTLVGGLAVAFWWARLGGYGHLDDAVVLCGAAIAIRLVGKNERRRAAMLIGLTIAFKPWAVVSLPLTLGRSGSLARRTKDPLIGALVGGALWLPFIIARPDTVQSLRPTVNVAYDSVVRLLGATSSDLPAWLRAAQLLGAAAVGVLAMRRGSATGAFLAAIAMRVATDPGTWGYYTAGLVLAALAFDLLQTDSVLPRMTIVISALMAPSYIVGDADARAVMRLVACVLAIVMSMVWTKHRHPAVPIAREPEVSIPSVV